MKGEKVMHRETVFLNDKEPSLNKVGGSFKWKRKMKNLVIYLLLTVFAAIVLFPFIWMVLTALKPNWMIYLLPIQWIPDEPQWGNFAEVFNRLPFWLYTKNTLILVFWNIVGTLLSCTIVAYGFARLNAPGKNILFLIMLSTMMLPPAVTMIPVFYIFKELGWINTFNPLTFPAFFASPFFVFLLRQFFMTIPNELEEAAKIDGAKLHQIIWFIILPLAKPALTTVAIFTFIGVWNDFFGPLIYLNDSDLYTMALGITFFVKEQFVEWNILMAASVLMIIPCLLIFFFAQRYFIEGITLTGTKG
jgi:ABC-type glycerol-3-phosphate transport system permease component